MHQQEAALKKFHDPFQPADIKRAEGHGVDHTAGNTKRTGASTDSSMQFDGLSENGSVQGHVQGPSIQATGSTPLRKPG
ncbi:hypothetical protein [Massilia sp. GCM10023247]|uniref:hypothetical protein n=1 Tax=Massilia sp. GCM10023247 TaxID=3252643 RepID=UPI0036D34DD7